MSPFNLDRQTSPTRATLSPAAGPGARTLAGLALLAFLPSIGACGGRLVGFDDDTEAPTITLTTPDDGAPSVPNNSSLTATFSEPMDGDTIDEESFVLRRDDLVIPGSVDFVGVTAILRPLETLLPTAVYTATVSDTVTDVAGNAMAADYVWTFTADGIADPDAPLVSFTVPANGDTNVSSNSVVLVAFSEVMDPTTFDSTTFFVTTGDEQVAGEISFLGRTAIFDPTEDMAFETVYTARVTNGVTDLAGNAMVNDYVWVFTTSASTDITPPVVTSTVPADGAEGIAFSASIAAAFSENMAPATISTATVFLENDGVRVEGTVVLVGVTTSFRPAELLIPNTEYTVIIDSTVTDTSGNELGEDYVWTFTTGADADISPPLVTETFPANESVDVAFNVSATATFTEPMDALSLNSVSVTMFDGSNDVVGAVTYMGNTVTFNPFNTLLPETTYTVSIDGSVTDLSGNPMGDAYSWSFTTGVAPDTTRPQVVETSPNEGAEDVASNASVVITFSEAMDPETVTAAEIRVFNGQFDIPGTVSYAGLTATFVPTGDFNENTLYVARVLATVTDTAGNSMLRSYVWTFTTTFTPDITAPTVVSTVPENGGGAVELSATLVATFSEPMAPLTTATFVLNQGADSVPGIVSNSGVNALFNPTNALLPSTVYTATIFNEATDASGNPLVLDYTWTFTTGLTPDVRRPEVSFAWPMDEATGVPIGGDIAAYISEAIAPLSATSGSFTLRRLGVLVPGDVTSSEGSLVFHPTAPLTPVTTYVATVTTAITDTSGNNLVRNYAWNFRTGNTADTTQPSILRTIPAFSATGASRTGMVLVEFSEIMDPISINGANVELRRGGTLIDGTVVHLGASVGFAPAATLDPSTTYTMTVTSAVQDLAGNVMQENETWTFTTGSAIDGSRPAVISTNPAPAATELNRDSSINATFDSDMDPLSLTVVGFTVTGPGGVEVHGSIRYLSSSRIVSFVPDTTLLASATYQVTLSATARNLSGIPMLLDHEWTFSTSDLRFSPQPIELGVLSGFAVTAGDGLDNSNPSGFTQLNGDVALNPSDSCIGDGVACTLLNPIVNGQLFINDGNGVSLVAQVDATDALAEALGRNSDTTTSVIPTGTYVGGVYSSAATTLDVSGNVILDGAGNPDSVWIFQSGLGITLADDTRVLLINGAQAKNVFWVATTLLVAGADVEMQGTILAGSNIVLGENATLLGRAFTVAGLISMTSNSILMPSL